MVFLLCISLSGKISAECKCTKTSILTSTVLSLESLRTLRMKGPTLVWSVEPHCLGKCYICLYLNQHPNPLLPCSGNLFIFFLIKKNIITLALVQSVA